MHSLSWQSHCLSAPRWLRYWLTDQGSLTQRLTRRCPQFAVRVLQQGQARPLPDESALFRLRQAELVVERDVLLLCRDQPAVFAHTIFTRESLRRVWQPVGRLGNRSLGTLLFSNPRIRRGSMQYRKLDRRHPLYRRIMRQTSGSLPASLWARRSLFLLDNQPMLVTEVFLPDLP